MRYENFPAFSSSPLADFFLLANIASGDRFCGFLE